MNIIGIDIGGSKTAVSRLTPEGKIDEFARFMTSGYSFTLARVLSEIRSLHLDSAPVIGISCGGPLDAHKGLILSPPNLPGWDRIAICSDLRSEFGGEAYLMNDANACCLAEWWFGAGRGYKHMVFLTSGTGMGAGMILNGALYEGATGDAGEIGHLRLSESGPIGYGKVGSVEGFCSGGGIARLATLREWQPPEPGQAITAKAVATAANQGDLAARAIFLEAGERLGQALAMIIDLVNPQCIVIGGFYPASRHLLEPSVREALARETLARPHAACAIVPAMLGETIGSHGAIAAALHAAKIEPSHLTQPSLHEAE